MDHENEVKYWPRYTWGHGGAEREIVLWNNHKISDGSSSKWFSRSLFTNMKSEKFPGIPEGEAVLAERASPGTSAKYRPDRVQNGSLGVSRSLIANLRSKIGHNIRGAMEALVGKSSCGTTTKYRSDRVRNGLQGIFKVITKIRSKNSSNTAGPTGLLVEIVSIGTNSKYRSNRF